MNGWRSDKERADIFMPTIKAILGRQFIGEATEIQDQKEATDLIVLEMRPFTIACRMRGLDYYHRQTYRQEITLRYSRPSGIKCEYDKIIDGWGDYFFYGFGDFQSGKIVAYSIIDLKALRAAFTRELVDFSFKDNHDKSSKFMVITATALPANCIVKKYDQESGLFAA